VFDLLVEEAGGLDVWEVAAGDGISPGVRYGVIPPGSIEQQRAMPLQGAGRTRWPYSKGQARALNADWSRTFHPIATGFAPTNGELAQVADGLLMIPLWRLHARRLRIGVTQVGRNFRRHRGRSSFGLLVFGFGHRLVPPGALQRRGVRDCDHVADPGNARPESGRRSSGRELSWRPAAVAEVDRLLRLLHGGRRSMWIGHHRIFRDIERHDDGPLWRSLLFLLMAAFMPFPTALQREHTIGAALAIYATSPALSEGNSGGSQQQDGPVAICPAFLSRRSGHSG